MPSILSSSFTPHHPDSFATFLRTFPSQTFAESFVAGLRFGLEIGYTGLDSAGPRVTPTLPSITIVRAYIAKEVDLKHAAGPFNAPPFQNFVVSSLGV